MISAEKCKSFPNCKVWTFWWDDRICNLIDKTFEALLSVPGIHGMSGGQDCPSKGTVKMNCKWI